MSLVLKKARKELGPTSGWPKLQECEHVKTSRKNIFVKKQKVVESARGEGQNYRIYGEICGHVWLRRIIHVYGYYKRHLAADFTFPLPFSPALIIPPPPHPRTHTHTYSLGVNTS